jgi:hypothetical protein
MDTLGVIAAIALPLWNIPLMIRISRRRSSRDISLLWTFGVLGCLLAMLPAGLRSPDRVFRVFAVANLALFSLVAIQVVRYREGSPGG